MIPRRFRHTTKVGNHRRVTLEFDEVRGLVVDWWPSPAFTTSEREEYIEVRNRFLSTVAEELGGLAGDGGAGTDGSAGTSQRATAIRATWNLNGHARFRAIPPKYRGMTNER